MKKRIMSLILAGTLLMSVGSCSRRVPETTDNSINTGNAEIEAVQEEEPSKAQVQERAEDSEGAEDAFSFAELANLQFVFSSGAGGWATMMTIYEDGSFSGEYFDGELGITGEGYPNGTMYQCNFSGQFTQPQKVNDYTYSMQISELNYAEEVGREEIRDGVQYCYITAYGLDDAEDILIYLPGAPLAELPEEFRSWIGYYDLSNTEDTELPFYALNNEAQQFGFTSYDIIDNLENHITSVELWAAELENSVNNDALTQTEYNEKSQELYEMWDSALNAVWDVLKQTQDAETMNDLTVEEREWIALKEQTVAEAGAEYEGGSMQQMIMNLKAAEMTKARVYELMELLGISEQTPENQIDYSGIYTDKQGTLDDIYSELELRKQDDDSYDFKMGIYCLTTLEGTATDKNGELHFVCEEPLVEGNIVINGDEAEVTITDSKFEYIQAGEGYSFLDGKISN